MNQFDLKLGKWTCAKATADFMRSGEGGINVVPVARWIGKLEELEKLLA